MTVLLRSRRLSLGLAFGVLAITSQGTAWAQADSATRHTGDILVMAIAGAAGSGAGTWVGRVGGAWASREWRIDRGGDDPGVAARAVGGLVGSVVGTALGTTLGAHACGRNPGAFGRRLEHAMAGLLIGLAASYAAGRLTSRLNSDHAAGLISYSVVQGIVAAVLDR